MRASRWLVAGLFLASAVVVQAQQPGGGRGPGGGSVTAQVLTNTALQDDLKLTDDQKAKLKAAADKQVEAGKKGFEAFKAAGGDKDKIKELIASGEKEREARRAEVTKLLDETLTADQKARLKQIDRQLAGVRAFGNDELVADLKLSDTQKTKIKGIVEEYGKDARELGGGFGKGGFDKEKAAEVEKKREKLQKGALADIDEVLNDDQRKTWKDMTGPAFDRTKLQQGGFGGFPGGGFGGKGRPEPKKD